MFFLAQKKNVKAALLLCSLASKRVTFKINYSTALEFYFSFCRDEQGNQKRRLRKKVFASSRQTQNDASAMEFVLFIIRWWQMSFYFLILFVVRVHHPDALFLCISIHLCTVHFVAIHRQTGIIKWCLYILNVGWVFDCACVFSLAFWLFHLCYVLYKHRIVGGDEHNTKRGNLFTASKYFEKYWNLIFISIFPKLKIDFSEYYSRGII